MVAAPITLVGNVTVIQNSSGAVLASLNGAIGGTGNMTFLTGNPTMNGGNTVTLGAASNFVGNVTITTTASTPANNMTVKLGVADALPATAVVTLDGQNGNGSSWADLNLNGFDQTLAGLRNIARTSRLQRVYNSGATAATLTISNTADYSVGGTLGKASGNNFALTKSGTGIFTLTGTLSYADDTTVTAGTLSLGSTNGGNNLSTVTVASGAKLELTYAGTDTVAALVINGAPQAGGVYGHTDSGATNGGQGVGFFDAYFEPGSGTLTIPGGFAAWITGTFANGTVTHQGPNDDDDNDGISNLVEYAIAGQDPTVPNAAIGSFDGSTLTFTKRTDTSGLTYAIQESTDLGDTDVWTEVPAGPTYTNNATTISYTLPGGPTKDFMRLIVTSN